MESPVVVDKPPEYGNMDNDRGFPFDEEKSGSAWSNLAARHPDIAARLRARPQTWARKRRPSAQDGGDDFGEEFAGFDRFPFDDIPPEFREHFPNLNRRFEPQQHQPQQEQPPPPQQEQQKKSQQQPAAQPPPPPPQRQTASTQTEPTQDEVPESLPQYGLRNTVDLGQKSPVDPSVDERAHRAVSAPPDPPGPNSHPAHPAHPAPGMSTSPPHSDDSSHVRHIPIFVEGRDEPVINKNREQHYTPSPEPRAAPPPPDREQYFADDGPAGFHHPPNFSRAFGTPFNKGFRQGPQPFTQQKAYPQAAQFARGTSPQRSQSPQQQQHPQHPGHPAQDPFVHVPVHHEPPRAQQKPQPPQKPQTQAPPPQAQPPPPPPPQPQAPSANDPITQILSIQTDVLNLMTEVENFTGSKKDKRYLFLDEMLTRNLIKLDTIETEGKENIRLARKEAIRCIQKCIAVLEAKAEKGSIAAAAAAAQEMEKGVENGHEEANETKETVEAPEEPAPAAAPEPSPAPAAAPEAAPAAAPEPAPAPASEPPADTRPAAAPETEPKPEPQPEAAKQTTKKKVVKKRDKSKEAAAAKNTKPDPEKTPESMQVDEQKSQTMEVDGAAASQ